MTQIANKVTGASFSRGSSKQDYATPEDFRAAVVKKFGMPSLDLAADDNNHFGPRWYSLEAGDDSFEQKWHNQTGLLWLNPPFNDIEPWAQKCFEESMLGARILLLVPASVGSGWYAKYVHNAARNVFFLNPRLSFDGKAPYPKDCLLALYGVPHSTPAWAVESNINTRYECWRWKTSA